MDHTDIAFSGKRTAEIVGITYRQLDYWARTDLIRPSVADAAGSGSRRRYSYRDLIELKVIKRLLDAGIKLESIRDAFAYLRDSLGEEVASAHLVICGNQAVLVNDNRELIDVVNRYQGQGVLNLLPLDGVVSELEASVAELFPADPTPPDALEAWSRAASVRAVKHSPLAAAHRALGAKLVPFGGWEMPLAYGEGTVAEHRACRTGAMAFDVSHLGTVRVTAVDGFDRLQNVLTNDLHRIGPGRAQYTHLLDDDASVLDDIIVWWVDEGRFDVMPNASNTDRVVEAIGGVDVTESRAVIAVQGPEARDRLATVAADAAAVGRFRVAEVEVLGSTCVVAGTGYTGEDGVEMAVPRDMAVRVWEAIVGAGIVPAGLGARDTLRLEAGLPLHGNELGPGITPLQAGLGWVVRWDTEFRGKDALAAERERGPARQSVGLLVDGRRPPRSGNPVLRSGEPIGAVTSGNFSPMLEQGIALALVSPDVEVGDRLTIDIRGTEVGAEAVKPPFWSGDR